MVVYGGFRSVARETTKAAGRLAETNARGGRETCMIATGNSAQFSEIRYRLEVIKPIQLPARSPNLNAYAERWVRSVKEAKGGILTVSAIPIVHRSTQADL